LCRSIVIINTNQKVILEEMKLITHRDIQTTITDPIIIQSFRATNLPVRTGTSHISNFFINSYEKKETCNRIQ